jgi:hypothetical protein
MRQTRSKLRDSFTASVMPESNFHRVKRRACVLCSSANVWWHTYCSAVIRNQLAPTYQSWTPSRPNSRNTGSPARNRRRTSASVVDAAMICCHLRSRKPWRSSPSASTRRAAFTDTPIHICRGGGLAQRLQRGGAQRFDSSVPLARHLPPGGLFLLVVRATRPIDGARIRPHRVSDGHGCPDRGMGSVVGDLEILIPVVEKRFRSSMNPEAR